MTLLTISWVRNESDIIEEFIRHHCRIAERMIIIDNGSTDDTPHILERLRAEGLPLELRTDPSDHHRQAGALTALMRHVSQRDDPDWIMPLDADEFLIGTGNENIPLLLADLPPDRAFLVPWRTYVPRPEDDASERNVLHRIRHRRSREDPQFTKVLVPRAFHRNASVRLAPGNHLLEQADGTPLPAHWTDRLAIAHFPVRSAVQLKRKVTDGWLRTQRDPAQRPNQNFHWHALCELLERTPSLTKENLQHIALRYAFREGEDTPDLLFDPMLQDQTALH